MSPTRKFSLARRNSFHAERRGSIDPTKCEYKAVATSDKRAEAVAAVLKKIGRRFELRYRLAASKAARRRGDIDASLQR